MMNLGHCEKLHRQGISNACHRNSEVESSGRGALAAEILEHLKRYNWGILLLSGSLIVH